MDQKTEQGFYEGMPEMTNMEKIAFEQKEIRELDQEAIQRAKKEKQAKEEANLTIDDIPILRESPWLLGGPDSVAQQAALKQLERLVRAKDKNGFYNQFEPDGKVLNFIDKVYIESSLLQDRYYEQQAKLE